MLRPCCCALLINSRLTYSDFPASYLLSLPGERTFQSVPKVLSTSFHVTRRSFESLIFLQVETPMKDLANCEGDVNQAKKLLGTLLWNFSRRQPTRSDSEWMVLWRDLCTLQEKAFPLVKKEYLLAEFCRGLLQAGKYSLAKNYLAGTGSMSLHPDEAEKVVLETAREFFYSAPSFDSSAVSITTLV